MNDPKRDELYKRIGAHVAKLRRQLGWTQERLAEEVGIDASYLARVESGTRRATLSTFREIAEALDQDLRDLIDEEWEPDPPAILPELRRALEKLSLDDQKLVNLLVRRLLSERTEVVEDDAMKNLPSAQADDCEQGLRSPLKSGAQTRSYKQSRERGRTKAAAASKPKATRRATKTR